MTDTTSAVAGVRFDSWTDVATAVTGLLPVGVPVVLLAAVVLVLWRVRRARWVADQQARARLLVVRPPVQIDPAAGEVWWRHLQGLLAPAWKRLLQGQPHLVVEYAFTAETAQVRVWVPPATPPGLVEHAITAAWPGATITEHPTDQSADLPATGVVVAGGRLGVGAPEWFPLRTDHDTDPLRPLFETGAHLHPGEQIRMQILTKPATGRRLRPVRRAAYQLRNPHHSGGVGGPAGLVLGVIRTVLDLTQPAPAASRSVPASASIDPYAADDLRLIRQKSTQPLWETAIRYAVTIPAARAAGRGRARGVADEVASAFAVYTARNHLRRHHLRRPLAVGARRRLGRGFLLSVPELAALAHLPLDDAVPGLEKAGARQVAPVSRIPTAGKVLGDADAGPRRPVAVSVPDGRHHWHVLGSTGSGKSTLLAHLALQDIQAGRGLVVIDPKGDLVTDILTRIPATAKDRLVVFDPDRAGPGPRFNVLDGADPDLVADHVVGIFHRIYTAWWGPRTDDVLRSAVLTLLHPANKARADVAHLGAVPRLLGEDAFRRRVTAPVCADDPVLRGFWSWYDTLSDAARAQVTGPVMNKLRAFLLRRFVRSTIAAGKSTVDMRQVLDGGVCLVRIPKGSLGEDTSRLLGSFLLARVWQSATVRARTGEHARRDAAVILDEAHNFLTLPHSLDDMLAEARGYRLSMVLSHQHLAQLPREVKEGVSANARNKVFFTLSPEDAAQVERHLHPHLAAHDLSHLDAFQAATRLITASRPAPGCTLRTRPLPDTAGRRGRAAA